MGTPDDDMLVAMVLNPVMICIGFSILTAYAQDPDIDFIDVDVFETAKSVAEKKLLEIFKHEMDDASMLNADLEESGKSGTTHSHLEDDDDFDVFTVIATPSKAHSIASVDKEVIVEPEVQKEKIIDELKRYIEYCCNLDWVDQIKQHPS